MLWPPAVIMMHSWLPWCPATDVTKNVPLWHVSCGGLGVSRRQFAWRDQKEHCYTVFLFYSGIQSFPALTFVFVALLTVSCSITFASPTVSPTAFLWVWSFRVWSLITFMQHCLHSHAFVWLREKCPGANGVSEPVLSTRAFSDNLWLPSFTKCDPIKSIVW